MLKKLKEAAHNLLKQNIADRDCFYDTSTNDEGEFETAEEERMCAEMDADIDKARAALWPEDDQGLLGILDEVIVRRIVQAAHWGGPEHDDKHSLTEWRDILDAALSDAYFNVYLDNRLSGEKWREGLIEIAALAVAAAQSWDRTTVTEPSVKCEEKDDV